MLKNTFIILAASSIIFGCGGRESNSSEPDVNNQKNVSNTPSTEYTVKKTDDLFKVKIVTNTPCGELPTAGSVIFHRDDGHVLLETDTDADGTLSMNWPEETKHISFIKVSENNGSTNKEIITWADITEYDVFEKVSFSSFDCQCEETEFDLSLLAESNAGYYISGINYNREKVEINKILKMCSVPKSQLLFIDDGDFKDIRAGNFLLGEIGTVKPKDSDFNVFGTQLNVSDLSNQTLSLVSLSQEGVLLKQSDTDRMYIFDVPSLKHYLNIESNSVATNSFSWSTWSLTQQVVNESGDIEQFQSINLTKALDAAITQFSNEATQSVSPSFEFVDSDQRMDQIQFYVSWSDSVNGNVKWLYNGKPSGKFPDFWLGKKVKQGVQSGTAGPNYLQLIATNFTGDYQEYVKYLHRENRTLYSDLNSGFLSNSTYLRVNGILNFR